MKNSEIGSILAAIVIATIVIGFSNLTQGNFSFLAIALLFAIIIVFIHVFTKKLMAFGLDADVEHKIWGFSRFGFKPHHYFKKEIPAGIILSLLLSLFSWGLLKIMPLLTYETRALKARASRRFGYYSYTEMTDWHNGAIGAAGIVAVLVVSLVAYFMGPTAEILAKMAAYYAFVNLIPISNLDGSQILFGSRVMWATLAIITLIFAVYSVVISVVI